MSCHQKIQWKGLTNGTYSRNRTFRRNRLGEFKSLLYDLIPPSTDNHGGQNLERDMSRKRWRKLQDDG